MASFKRIVKNEKFLKALVKAKRDPKQLKRIIKHSKGTHLLSLAEIFKNLKKIPLTPNETTQYRTRREAIKKFITKNTKCALRKNICLKRTSITAKQRGKGKRKGKRSGCNQIGGIFPLIPVIASIGVNLLSSLLKNNNSS
jgi:hypothetical protein